MKCPKCNNKIPDNVPYCYYCGAPIIVSKGPPDIKLSRSKKAVLIASIFIGCLVILSGFAWFVLTIKPVNTRPVTEVSQRILTVTVEPADSGSVIPDGGTFERGEEVKIEARPAINYIFDRWGGDLAGNDSTISLKMDNNKKVIAFFLNTISRITFTSNRDGNNEIYLINADGTNQKRLTNVTAWDYGPSWSPDGKKIAFTSDRDGDPEIYVMNADGSNPMQLTNNTLNDAYPSWSPDGSKIAFSSNRDIDFEIYVMNSDGSNPTRLTNSRAADDNPSWAPDGSKIAFISYRDNQSEIYVMNSGGSNPTRLTNQTGFYPSWAPNGSKIAFTSLRDGNYEIYIMNADGSKQIRLTNNTDVDQWPVWSPDGSKIAFSHESEIYIMNIDGTDQTRLANGATGSYPAWSPLPK